MMDIANEIPEFGGMFIDDRGVMVVYLTDPAKEAVATAAVEDFIATLGSERGSQVVGIEVRPGRYGVVQLLLWRRLLESNLEFPGIISTDFDEAVNRLVFGVETPSARERVQDLVLKLQVPAEAITIQEVDPVRPLATLEDYVRPLAGGLRIASTVFCTMGFIAEREGILTFITNSHCTNVGGGVEGTLFAQPDATFGTIGVEIADPVYSSV